ncbi:alpha/beta-hydrolase, partial [Cryphonectria parasitica EP155]
LLVIPRPWSTTTTSQDAPQPAPIRAPTEADMTKTFGSLLPQATYLTTPQGRAAYYDYPPTTSTNTTTTAPSSSSPDHHAAPLRILMIHGIQTPALGLQPLATDLRSRFPTAHIALLDLWGHGLTDTPLSPHVPSLFYSLLDAVLAALGWQSSGTSSSKVHLVGYSFGGSLAAGYAALRPEAVASVSFIAPAGLMWRSALFSEEAQTRHELAVSSSSSTLDLVLEFLEGGKLVVPDDWRERVGKGEVVAEAVRDWEMKTHAGHAGSVVAIFRDGAVFDNHAAYRAAVEAVGVDRCLGVVGELDEVCSRQDLLDVGFSNVAVVPQAGHAVVRQRVPDVATLIEEFW